MAERIRLSEVIGRRRRDPARLDVPPVGRRSWWLEEALRADPGEPCPAAAGELAADVCIVGGGFAGLWTAYELHERDPDLGLVVVEADIVGAGASGANGGFFSPSWTQLAGLCAALGEEGGVAYAAALAAAVDELDGWIARHAARVDAWHEGILYARAGEWQPGPGAETFRLLQAHGYADRLRAVDAAGARAIADSPRFVGGDLHRGLLVRGEETADTEGGNHHLLGAARILAPIEDEAHSRAARDAHRGRRVAPLDHDRHFSDPATADGRNRGRLRREEIGRAHV